jgi:chromosome segregation ATPase
LSGESIQPLKPSPSTDKYQSRMVACVSYQLSGAQERRRNNEAKANEYYEKVRKQEQELRDLQAKLGNTEKQFADLQVQKSEIDGRLRQLATSMDSTNRALADLRTQITGRRQAIERDQAEMAKYQDEVVRLDREIGELMKRRA